MLWKCSTLHLLYLLFIGRKEFCLEFKKDSKSHKSLQDHCILSFLWVAPVSQSASGPTCHVLLSLPLLCPCSSCSCLQFLSTGSEGAEGVDLLIANQATDYKNSRGIINEDKQDWRLVLISWAPRWPGLNMILEEVVQCACWGCIFITNLHC